VAETSNQETEKTWRSTAARFGWVVLILVTLYVCYFSHLGAIGFVGPDEPRYAWIARDMMETGDWVTPRLYGKPWFEKPPLFYWGAALTFKLLGVSEAAARLPSAISALLATLALAWLALRLYSAETARWLLLLLPTTVGMIGFSHAAATDMPFSGMLTIAMVAAAVVVGLVPQSAALSSSFASFTPSTFFASVLFGFFLGLAVLAKGPAGIVLCGGTVFFWALFTKRWRDAVRLLHPAGIVTFCVTALPWYVLCARRNPDFLRVFIIEHNFKRYLTPEFQHIQPFWFYIPILMLAFLPWTLMFAFPLVELVRRRKSDSSISVADSFFSCWAIFTLVFFSSSQSKLPGYILPAVPPLAFLLAQSNSLRFRKVLAGDRSIAISASLAILGLSLFSLSDRGRIPLATDFFPPRLTLLFLLDFVTALVALTMAMRRRSSVAVILCASAILLTFGLGMSEATGPLDRRISPRWAAEFAEQSFPHGWAANSATCGLRRSFQYSLNFYAHRELPQWSGNAADYEWVFISRAQIKELQSKGFKCPSFMAYPVVIVCERQKSASSSPGGGKPQ
jgi:4-amino-4-deoxy-L-arabinose transferase-like glycosyltransferase